jgi:predicted protein tyrosine phosphatase
MPTIKLLFICSLNRWRSPTAEQIFSGYPGIETSSAGINRHADNPVTSELIEAADIIFVMEKAHKAKLAQRFSGCLHKKRIICLNIPDQYKYMDEKLIAILHARVTPFL